MFEPSSSAPLSTSKSSALEPGARLARVAYFRELLRTKQIPTPLPRREFARSRPAGNGREEVTEVLDAEVERRLAELAQVEGTTWRTLVLAAWAVVMGRFTGHDDLVFGVRLEGSPAPLPVRVAVAGTVRDLVRSLHAQALALRGLDPPSLAELQENGELCLGAPLFETSIGFTEHELGLAARSSTDLPLVLELRQDLATKFCLSFDRARFDQVSARRVLESTLHCLSELAHANADTALLDLGVLPESERHKLLVEWNDTARPFEDEVTLHQLFERQVLIRPQAPAVEAQGRTLSFSALDQQASRLAHALCARGIGPGKQVGICLRRSPDLIAALLAVSKAGAAYVPLDPQYPIERLRRMLADSGAALVVTEACLESRLPGVQTLALDEPEFARELAESSEGSPEARSSSSDPCYVLYTSGSTGTPKGVVLTHHAVVNTLDWVNRTFEVGPGDRALFVTSPSFDLSVYDVFGVLAAGATVVVADEAMLADPQALGSALLDRQITLWNSAPSFLQWVLPTVIALSNRRPLRPALRLALLSGDWIPLDLVRVARDVFPNARLISLGGATEAAIWSNWFPIERLEPHWLSVPYGRPIQNCRYYVLDERQRPVPVGAIGELYIAGVCLARGYLNRPDLTAQRFIPDPFSAEPEARLYRSGDLARYYEDGQLELLGRVDGQLKIRGFRVELAEIEAALSALPEVAQAICAAEVDGSGQKALTAYVAVRPETIVSEQSLKASLARTLPAFMIPARIVLVDALPLTPNGKIDRNALSEQKRAASDVLTTPLATATERRVAAIWQRLLQRSSIRGSDNFLALGGHSLLAVQAFAELERELGVPLHVAALFEYPTLSALAARIDQLLTAADDAAADWTTVVPVKRDGSLPPLFCVAGAGGNPIGMRNLIPQLDAEQPLYGLRHRGVDGRLPPHATIPEMASEFLADIRRVQPSGPYYLAGFSGGGVAAYEMAQQLRSRGERVALLILLDAFSPAVRSKTRASRLSRLLRHTVRYGLTYLLSRAAIRLGSELRKARQSLRRPRRSADHIQSRDEGMFTSFRAALSRYTPLGYRGDALLIRCRIEIPLSAEGDFLESNGWEPLIDGRLEVVTVDCAHDELLGTHAAVAAGYMRAALDAVRRGR